MLKVEVVKLGDEYGVNFSIDHQGFRLDYRGTKEEAEFMRQMLLIALNRLRGQNEPYDMGSRYDPD